MAKQKCNQCGRELSSTTGFYMSNSKLNTQTGRLPICKNCLEERYLDLLSEYEGDSKKAFKHLLLNFDIYFNEGLYEECLRDKQTLVKSYMTKVNTKVETREKTSINNLMTDEDSDEIDKELIYKWGVNWTKDQYQSLERREAMYLENYPSETLQEKEIIHSLCEYKELENSARACGDDKTVERYSNLISNKMGQLDVIPSKMKNYGESVENMVGMMALTIEKEEPIPSKYPEFDDVDGILKLMMKYFIKPMRKALSITKTDYAYDYLDTGDDEDDDYI